MASRYLPAEAIALLETLARKHPLEAGAAVIGSFALVITIFRWRAGRTGPEVFLLGIFVTALLLFVGACVYLLVTQPGFHFALPR